MSTSATNNNATDSKLLQALIQDAIDKRRTVRQSKRTPGSTGVEAALRAIAFNHSHPSNARKPEPVLDKAIATEKQIVLAWLAQLIAVAEQTQVPKEQAGIYEYWRTYARFAELRRDKLREMPLPEAQQFMVRHCPASPKPLKGLTRLMLQRYATPMRIFETLVSLSHACPSQPFVKTFVSSADHSGFPHAGRALSRHALAGKSQAE